MLHTPPTPELVYSVGGSSPTTPSREGRIVAPSTPRRNNAKLLAVTPRTPRTPSPKECAHTLNSKSRNIKMLRINPRPVPFRLDDSAKLAVKSASCRLHAVTQEDDLFAPVAEFERLSTWQSAPGMVRRHSAPGQQKGETTVSFMRETQSMHFGLPRSPRIYDLASRV